MNDLGNVLELGEAELLDGPKVASQFIDAVQDADLIVGHGILTTDFRALAMVEPIPATVVKKSVDTLLFISEIRGTGWPTGCGLSDLMISNRLSLRRKPSFPVSAPGLRSGESVPSPRRGSFDPRDDALSCAELWAGMLFNHEVAWSSGRPVYTYQGPVGTPTPGGSARLDGTLIAVLCGHTQQLKFVEWRQRLASRGSLFSGPPDDLLAVALSGLSAQPDTNISQLQDLADCLSRYDLLPQDIQGDREMLFASIQRLGAVENLDVRTRLSREKRLLKEQRRQLARSMWKSANWRMWQSFLSDKLARGGSATSTIRSYQAQAELQEVFSLIDAVIV